MSCFSSVVSVLKYILYWNAAVWWKCKSAQNIFVNQWCAINGQVLFSKSIFCLQSMVNCLKKRRRMYFSFKCDWGESKKTPCDLWNRLLDQVTSHVQLYFVCFIFLFDIACSFSCVQWRACLQSAVCLVKPYLSKISPLSRSRTCLACPLLFCTLYAFHVQCFKLCWFYPGHAFSVYTWCCIRFPVHIV